MRIYNVLYRIIVVLVDLVLRDVAKEHLQSDIVSTSVGSIQFSATYPLVLPGRRTA